MSAWRGRSCREICAMFHVEHFVLAILYGQYYIDIKKKWFVWFGLEPRAQVPLSSPQFSTSHCRNNLERTFASGAVYRKNTLVEGEDGVNTIPGAAR